MGERNTPPSVVATDEDITIMCRCGSNFIFTADEQRFFQAKQLSEPRACPACRKQKRKMRDAKHNEQQARVREQSRATLGDVITLHLGSSSST
jgi:hypothetical protein